MRKATHLLLALFTVIGMAACGTSGGISTNPGDMIGNWELQSVDGTQSDQGDVEFTLSFNRDGTIAGVADCNRYAGQYSAAEGEEDMGSLSIESFAATQVECPQQRNTDFVNLIENVNSFQVREGEQLVLNTSDNQEVILVRAPEANMETTNEGMGAE